MRALLDSIWPLFNILLSQWQHDAIKDPVFWCQRLAFFFFFFVVP